MPAIDGDFRKAVLSLTKDGQDGWSALLRETASQLIAKKKRPAVLALAWQCWQIDDQPCYDHAIPPRPGRLAEPRGLPENP